MGHDSPAQDCTSWFRRTGSSASGSFCSESPLHLAARQGYTDILCKHGLSVNATNVREVGFPDLSADGKHMPRQLPSRERERKRESKRERERELRMFLGSAHVCVCLRWFLFALVTFSWCFVHFQLFFFLEGVAMRACGVFVTHFGVVGVVGLQVAGHPLFSHSTCQNLIQHMWQGT